VGTYCLTPSKQLIVRQEKVQLFCPLEGDVLVFPILDDPGNDGGADDAFVRTHLQVHNGGELCPHKREQSLAGHVTSFLVL
jgi:hypothetical protein